jgi:hypothetical protein
MANDDSDSDKSGHVDESRLSIITLRSAAIKHSLTHSQFLCLYRTRAHNGDDSDSDKSSARDMSMSHGGGVGDLSSSDSSDAEKSYLDIITPLAPPPPPSASATVPGMDRGRQASVIDFGQNGAVTEYAVAPSPGMFLCFVCFSFLHVSHVYFPCLCYQLLTLACHIFALYHADFRGRFPRLRCRWQGVDLRRRCPRHNTLSLTRSYVYHFFLFFSRRWPAADSFVVDADGAPYGREWTAAAGARGTFAGRSYGGSVDGFRNAISCE